MVFSFENGMWTVSTEAVLSLAVAMCFLMLGYTLRDKVHFLESSCLPPAVIGGLIFSLITLLLHSMGIAEIELDTTFQSPAMVAFFTCIGLTGSLAVLKKGGRLMLVYWLLIAVIVIVQSVIPLTASKLTGFSPVYAILAGTTTMSGGHGNGGAYGLTAQELGYAAGQTVGLACATFGVISGALSGGPFAKHLIEKNSLKPNREDLEEAERQKEAVRQEGVVDLRLLLKHVTFLAVLMGLGTLISDGLSGLLGGTITIPAYVGGMVLGVIMRNVDDKTHFMHLNLPLMDRISEIMVSVYLALAMCSMQLWQLVSLFIPLLLILCCQVIFDLVYTRFVVYPVLIKVGGSGYDAAVMCSGFLGHTLGATPNAIANMNTVTEKYGPSQTAMLVVPPTASFLTDLIMIPTIVISFNLALSMAMG